MADVAGQGAWGAGHLGPYYVGIILIIRVIMKVMAGFAPDNLAGHHIVTGGFYDSSVMA